MSTVCDLEVSVDYQSKPVSDHSILSWLLFHNVPGCHVNISPGRNMKKAKKVLSPDLRKIPPHFLYSSVKDLSSLAEWLHYCERSELSGLFNGTDFLYNYICSIFQAVRRAVNVLNVSTYI